ncbi:helix-turn-helix transcriptional regulator [Dysgonomonas sp. Marseille-P4677]|uniref:helix-turn-helix domain-containing protein n=1 Tax=Dysgonomonas sp. Marseille-P4677 TaxID=2364790 RepID=UPI001913F07A|nr:AraC family transcriptional regulator [Dysgonomonas sp. Marseille-P4677]MBK5721809.1 helix-turn-helix transcriptional regulator [Dysgonomonas sp. Marseille-P4677]
MKHLKAPTGLAQLPTIPFKNKSLKINDSLAIASSEHTFHSTGSMYLEEHMLLFVLDGVNTLTHGRKIYVVRKNEMILLRKATIWQYDKEGNNKNNNVYDSMMFFLKDEFLKDFVKMANIKIAQINEPVTTIIKPIGEYLLAYINSLKPYFKNTESIDSGLLRLKTMELLYDLALTDDNLLQQILQLKQPPKTDITSVMEQNYMNHLSLSEFAYLSGRSLSSFKRDFMSVYNAPPSLWIRNRRLEKGKELLISTSLSITDICHLAGFENATHFSRIFKEKYGYSPSKRK